MTASNGPEKITTPAQSTDIDPGELRSKSSTKIWIHPLQNLDLAIGTSVEDLSRELSHWTDFIVGTPIETPKNKRFVIVAHCRVGKSYSANYMLHEATSYPLNLVKHWPKMSASEIPKLCDGLAATIIEFVNRFGAKL